MVSNLILRWIWRVFLFIRLVKQRLRPTFFVEILAFCFFFFHIFNLFLNVLIIEQLAVKIGVLFLHQKVDLQLCERECRTL